MYFEVFLLVWTGFFFCIAATIELHLGGSIFLVAGLFCEERRLTKRNRNSTSKNAKMRPGFLVPPSLVFVRVLL